MTTFAVHYETPTTAHVYPVSDLMEHVFDGTCPCGPASGTDEDGTIYEHHSLDGREVEVPKED